MESAARLVMFAMTMAVDGGAPPPAPASRAITPAADPAKPPARPLNLLAPIGADPAPPVKPESYDLRPAGDGSGELLYDEVGFSARVARDGAVTFGAPKRNLTNLLAPFLPKAGPRNVPSLFTTIVSHPRTTSRTGHLGGRQDERRGAEVSRCRAHPSEVRWSHA